MTMDLIAPHGEQHFTLSGWKMLLDLALQNGWEPAGALPREHDDEDELEDEAEEESADEPEDDEEFAELPEGTAPSEVPQDHSLARLIMSFFPSPGDPVMMAYFTNDGNRVTPEDARALADALEQALPDLPDHDAMAHKTVAHPAAPGARFIHLDTPINPMEWFSGKKKEHLREFIAFCCQGGFEIW